MKKARFLALITCSSFLLNPLYAYEETNRAENMKVLFQEILSDSILHVFAEQTIDALEQEIDPEYLVEMCRKELMQEPMLTTFSKPYAQFSDEEIADLCALLTCPVYKKFTTEGTAATISNIEELSNLMATLAQNIEAPRVSKQTAPSQIEEVTLENFASFIGDSKTPVILDIYASWCPPCKKLGVILERAVERYPQIRFGKVNADTQQQLAGQLKVNSLPTLLFFLPGNKTPSMKSIGFITENALDEKIDEFLTLSENS